MNGHPTPMGAVLYTVRGPRGSYFAVHDPATGQVFTERTEQAARQQARDQNLILVSEEEISHQDLLRRTGREADAASQPSNSVQNPRDVGPQIDGSPDRVIGQTSLSLESPFLLDDTGETFVARRGGTGGVIFSSHPLEPQYSDFSDNSMLWQNMPPTLSPPEEDWKAPEQM
jgi:hypothetical protein